jgi:hypothetical protein
MKRNIVIVLFSAFLFVLNVNAQQKPSEILGTWKLVSYKYGESDIKFATDSFQRIKLITPTYFTWIHYSNKDKMVSEMAGGTYTLTGGDYVEKIGFGGNSMRAYFNTEQAFKLKFENGKMYQFGVMTDNQRIEEIWEKID